MPLSNKVAQFDADSDLINAWVHGPATGVGSTITTDSGPVRTPAKLINDVDVLLLDFNSRYLGPLSANPTLNLVGQPVVVGNVYFNIPTQVMRVYAGGGVWRAFGSTSTGGESDRVFVETNKNVTADYTLSTGFNAMSAGPVSIDLGVTVTVPVGAVWTIV
jgi:hypothetical protein